MIGRQGFESEDSDCSDCASDSRQRMMNEAMTSSVIVVNKEAVVDEETKLLSPTSHIDLDSGVGDEVDKVSHRNDCGARDSIEDDWEVLMLARIKCGLWQVELNMNTRMWIMKKPLVQDRINSNYYKDYIRSTDIKQKQSHGNASTGINTVSETTATEADQTRHHNENSENSSSC